MNYVCYVACDGITQQLADEKDCRFVYILQCEDTGRIKIGVADDVDARHTKIQSMSPSRLNLVATFPCLHDNNLEAALHRRFAKHRIHGEWFEPDDAMIDSINELTDGQTKETASYGPDIHSQKAWAKVTPRRLSQPQEAQ